MNVLQTLFITVDYKITEIRKIQKEATVGWSGKGEGPKKEKKPRYYGSPVIRVMEKSINQLVTIHNIMLII